ncbi:MAG TPA: Fic family protein [Pyrinomonadaceae bacterium]
MDATDRRYFNRWLRALGKNKPAGLWQRFLLLPELPPLNFSNEVSAVYSAAIEGNTVDLNSYMRSKTRGQRAGFKEKEFAEIEALVGAYKYAQRYALNEENLLAAHSILSTPLLPKSGRGRYRRQPMAVYSRHGIEYVAVEPEFVPEKMGELLDEVRELRRAPLDAAEVFYHAALIHLVFVHIHPFADGNGRAARLLEKWFLASHLGREAWHIPSEWYYKQNRGTYYRTIKIGVDYYSLDYDRCIPFLTLLVKALVP